MKIKTIIKSIIEKVFNLNIDLYKQKSFYKKLITPDSLCFDIGANIGYKSKIFLSLNANVIAFEPQSDCKKYLQNINNPNFQFYSFGVGSQNETKLLNLANHTEVATFSDKMMSYYKTKTLDWHETESVTVKKLDTLIKEFGLPDFCKIDTEGYELEILTHLTYKIPIIEFEFAAAFVDDTVQIISLLENEHTVFNFNLNEKPKFELSKWINAQEMIIIFNKLPIERLHGNIFVKNMKSNT